MYCLYPDLSADPQDTFEQLNNEGFSVGIPVFRIKREVADVILSKSKTTIESLEKNINDQEKTVQDSQPRFR